MTLLHRIVAVLAVALLATSALAQQPAKKTDFNATCLPCRGFAQTLRMYEDAITALQQERDKRSAALQALTAAIFGGPPLTDEQKAQAKIDGDTLKMVLDKLDTIEVERANAEKTLKACIQKYCPIPDPKRELWYDPGMPQPPWPPGTLPPAPPGGTLMGDGKPIEVPAGGNTPYPATGMDDSLSPRAECPECRDAENKYRQSEERVEAADRNAEDARFKRAAAAYAVNDPASLLPIETARASYDEADKAVKAAEAESTRLRFLRFNAMMDLKDCNRLHCRGKPEDDPARRWWLGDGKPTAPPTGVMPGGGAPVQPPTGVMPGGGAPAQPPTGVIPGGGAPAGAPVTPPPKVPGSVEGAPLDFKLSPGVGSAPIVPPANYGISEKLQVGSSRFDLSGRDGSGWLGIYGPYSVLGDPGLGTPIAPAAGPCGCDELLRLKKEADYKSGYALYKFDDASAEATNAKAAYEAAVKNPDIPPKRVLELYEAYDVWQTEMIRLMSESQDQDYLAKSYKSRYDECMKHCTGPEPPRLVVAINTSGNNPFNTYNPLGGALVITPPGSPDATGSVQLSSPNYGGAEGSAVLVTVVRTGGRRGAASVSYQTSGGNATAGADYQPASGTLAWADGDDSPKSFSIALTDDGQAEAVETFNVSLGVFTGATPGSPLLAVVSITDKDSTAPAGSLQLSSSTYPTAEGAGAVTITVLRVNGNNGAVSVQYSTAPGSATAGSDYQAVNGTLQWPTGDVGARTFTVPIIDDAQTEQTETFSVTLNNPTGGATLGVPATATVSIQDNDLSTPIGPCGAVGNAWQPNAGGPYTCSGSCQPIPSNPFVTVNGDFVTITPFHAGGAATFQGCGTAINSQSNNMIFFGQPGHSATATRESLTSFLASIRSNTGGSCDFRCTRPPPVR